MLRYKGDKKLLNSYVEQNPEYFDNLDKETAYVIGELLDSKDILKTAEGIREGERMSMCKALEDLYNEGKLEGKLEAIRGMMEICREMGLSLEDTIVKIADKLEEEEDKVKDEVIRYWKE